MIEKKFYMKIVITHPGEQGAQPLQVGIATLLRGSQCRKNISEARHCRVS
ncbi:MAG: hypothetical protein ACLFQV_00270 [Vulcanimicrobiota bacterium]